MIRLDLTSNKMSAVTPHWLSYYGLPEHADQLMPIITLAGGTVIDVLDDWQTGIEYWATIQFSGTDLVFRKVQGIAAIVSGNLQVRAGTPEPEPEQKPSFDDMPLQEQERDPRDVAQERRLDEALALLARVYDHDEIWASPAVVPSPEGETQALIDEIAVMDQAALAALEMQPAFNRRVLGLSFPDQDRVLAAKIARLKALARAS